MQAGRPCLLLVEVKLRVSLWMDAEVPLVNGQEHAYAQLSTRGTCCKLAQA